MPKPTHLTWEEAAVNALCNSTSYRMIVSQHAAGMKQGDAVLIWGATGGIGGYAVQYVLNGGGTPVGVVSSPERRPSCCATMGCEHVIDRKAKPATSSGPTSTPRTRRSGAASARTSAASSGATSTSCSSTPAAQTFGASVFVAARGGKIVTCAATSGYMIEYDNRHLWMKLKSIVARATSPTTRRRGRPTSSSPRARSSPCSRAGVLRLDETGEAAYERAQQRCTEGKLGVLCLAPEEGLGIDDPEFREQVGEDKITLFRNAG